MRTLYHAVVPTKCPARGQRLCSVAVETCALSLIRHEINIKQAEATAAMEMEDRRSQAVRARLKKEETYALWENEDRRTKETRSTVREDLEDAARREYLEVCGWFEKIMQALCTIVTVSSGHSYAHGTSNRHYYGAAYEITGLFDFVFVELVVTPPPPTALIKPLVKPREGIIHYYCR